jgi:hypothetical protein
VRGPLTNPPSRTLVQTVDSYTSRPIHCNSVAMRRTAFLGFLVLAVIGTDLPEVHVHSAETPGLYNEECPLARLAVPGWSLPALARETLPQAEPVSGPPPSPPLVQPERPARSAFAPRAPPATS